MEVVKEINTKRVIVKTISDEYSIALSISHWVLNYWLKKQFFLMLICILVIQF